MNIEEVREVFRSFPNNEECTPFGDDVLVYKNESGKMYGLIFLGERAIASMKCDPDRAVELREQFPDIIIPAYHMNKKHCNSVCYEHFSQQLFTELAKHSFELVGKKK